jgi:hypothetical protein
MVDPKGISYIKVNDGTYDKRAKTILIVSGQHQAVRETVPEILKLMDEK